MYARKSSDSRSSARQSADVLLKILSERNRDLGVHLDQVTSLAGAVADRLGLPDEERAPLVQAARCTTSARPRSPTASSTSRARSTTRSGSSCAATR